MIRVARLQDDVPGAIAASGPPRDLREQLERALAGAEVRYVQRGVGVQDADQRDPRKVMPLGHELRAEQDARLALREAVEHGLGVAARARAVGVEAVHGGAGKELRQLALDALRARHLVAEERMA